MIHRVRDRCRKPSLAHVRRNDDRSFAVHGLEAHLRAVGGMARCVIAKWGPQWAALLRAADARASKDVAR
jgi:hypothetical protein